MNILDCTKFGEKDTGTFVTAMKRLSETSNETNVEKCQLFLLRRVYHNSWVSDLDDLKIVF